MVFPEHADDDLPEVTPTTKLQSGDSRVSQQDLSLFSDEHGPQSRLLHFADQTSLPDGIKNALARFEEHVLRLSVKHRKQLNEPFTIVLLCPTAHILRHGLLRRTVMKSSPYSKSASY
jgi:hypothetical protein